MIQITDEQIKTAIAIFPEAFTGMSKQDIRHEIEWYLNRNKTDFLWYLVDYLYLQKQAYEKQMSRMSNLPF